MSRVAFVIPWYRADLVGGAEQEIFDVTTRLARRGHPVEVLATCCRSFQDDWARNDLPAGVSEEMGVVVRRFPVRPRSITAFDAANRELIALNGRRKPAGVPPVSESAAAAFVNENIHSPKLLDHLEREGSRYQAIVFVPYLYGPTLLGVPRAGSRAMLQPLLHDETYAYLPAVETMFHGVPRILFISEGEALLAARLYGPSIWRKGTIVGGGVEIREDEPAAPIDDLVPGLGPRSYALYLGRRDSTKNTDFLLRAFHRYRESHRDARLQLVLAGPGTVPRSEARCDGVIDLGLVADRVKSSLLTHCRVLVQPSLNESYSRTMMEAWLHGRPVAVHEQCLATSRAVESSGGGWAAASEAAWADIFAMIEAADEATLAALGRRGKDYAREHADWEKVIDRYEEVLGLRHSPGRPRKVPRTIAAMRTIHQLTPALDYGDAISNQALFIAEVLRDLGHRSEILVEHLGPGMAELGKRFVPGAVDPDDAILYHHGIATPLAAHAVRHAGPKALVYHNITPAPFFERWDPAFAKLLEQGRKDLHDLAASFPVSAGASAFNAHELQETGFKDPMVLPIFVDPMRWALPADPEWMKILQDGSTNLLFVGRVAPNKCQHHLVQAFHEYLRHDPGARLILVGGWPDGHPYARFVREEADRLGIAGNVLMISRLADAQLLACYRTAHLFWSMSEHEGFCVPLIEAMWFDVPVLAYRSSAIPETLGQAGIMFTGKRWPELAALAHLLVEDPALRRKVIAAQRARRSAFLPDCVLPALLDLLARMGVHEDVSPQRGGESAIPDTSREYASMIRGQR